MLWVMVWVMLWVMVWVMLWVVAVDFRLRCDRSLFQRLVFPSVHPMADARVRTCFGTESNVNGRERGRDNKRRRRKEGRQFNRHSLEFNRPWGIAFDRKHQKIIVFDRENHRVQYFNRPDLKHLASVGSKGNQKSQFNIPTGEAPHKNSITPSTTAGYCGTIRAHFWHP